MNNIKLYEKIRIELCQFSFKRTSMSYQYLVEAIFIVTQDRMSIRDFNRLVYPRIAQKYNTKPENVLWCIAKLLRIMYLNTDSSIINNYFGVKCEENPSTKAFIIHISEKVLEKIDAENRTTKDFLQIML